MLQKEGNKGQKESVSYMQGPLLFCVYKLKPSLPPGIKITIETSPKEADSYTELCLPGGVSGSSQCGLAVGAVPSQTHHRQKEPAFRRRSDELFMC